MREHIAFIGAGNMASANTYKAVETLGTARLNLHAVLRYVSTEHDVRQQRGHFGLPRAADLFHHLP